ncbi:MAG: sulfatase-like hydrolase/transferase, partial [Clostridia bacterium]|nr:sulfatase-like hydrolase/transferase [Clostridia bacterium]
KDDDKFMKEREGRMLRCALAAIAIPLMIFIVIPFEIYCGNIDEFTFSVDLFLPTALLLFIISSCFSFLLLFLVPEKVFRVIYAIFTATALMLFIQGMFLNFGIDSLAGDEVGQGSVSTGLSILDLIIWILVEAAFITVVCLKPENFAVKTACIIISVSIIGTQLINFTTLSLTTPNVYDSIIERNQKQDAEYYPYKLTYDNLTNISKKDNVFVFVVDRFDRVFSEVALKHDPSIFSELDGFTYYDDNISLYGHTYPALANMVTGVRFKGENRKSYLHTAYDNATTLEEMKNNGYQVNVYAASYYGYNSSYYISKYVSNAKAPSLEGTEVKTTSKGDLTMNLVQMGLFRSLPHVAKDLVSDVTSNSCNSLVYMETGKEQIVEYSTKLDVLEEYYDKAEFNLVDEKVFSFIHYAGCHDLYFGGGADPDKLSSERIDKTLDALKKNFDMINKYIRKMKEWGVYDDATIIITGDHGSAISDKKPLDGIRTTALFVKPKGSSGSELKKSSAQVCHDNMWPTIFQSAGISTKTDYGKSVFDIKEGEDMERTYLWHAMITDEETKNKSFIEYRYTIKGSALDFNNWEITDQKEYDKYLYA